MIVKTRTATYVPRFRVGASSEVTARAVSSLIPAPAPAIAIPATFIGKRVRHQYSVRMTLKSHQ